MRSCTREEGATILNVDRLKSNMTEPFLNVTSCWPFAGGRTESLGLFCNVSLAGQFFQGGGGRDAGTEQESGHGLQMCCAQGSSWCLEGQQESQTE